MTAREILAVSINGQPIPVVPARTWKSGHTLNLAPYLIADSSNELQIRVSGMEGPPALLVEGPRAIRSGIDWQVALSSEPDKREQAVIALQGESQLMGKYNPLRTSSKFPFYLTGFLLYCLLIIYALIPLRLKPWMKSADRWMDTWVNQRSPATKSHCNRFLRQHGFCLLLMLIVAVVQLHNVIDYPHTRSHFDWKGHVDYIQYVAQHWRVPNPTDGWEMFQPPLYYFSSALIYKIFGGISAEPASLKAVQVYTTLIGLGNIGLAWWMLWMLFPDRPRRRNLGFSVVAMLPMNFYMNAMISNEIFSGGIIGLAIFLAVRYGFREKLRWRDAFLIGLGCGLALLSKYTGLFILLSTMFLLLLRMINRRGNWRWGLLLVTVTLALCGWFYARNLMLFKDPFIGNWDPASGFHYEQHPGYRTFGFYTRFGSLFFHLPEYARWSSFWDGKYASMWMDTHGTFLNPGDRRTQILGTQILWLALLPATAILVGFGKAVKSLLWREWDHPYLILVLTSVLTVISLISFTMEVPTYSTIKAFFFLSLISSLGVFAALGLDTMCLQLGRLRWLLYGNLGALYGIILYLFWYRGT